MASDTEVTFSSIAQLISEGPEETLHLEFKTLADSSGERITKDDRRIIAKAICGMANAEGGKIIIGVETKRVDNVDVAVGQKPIQNLERLRSLLTAAIPEMLSPQLAHIQVSAAAGSDGAGFVTIEVPQSDARPYHSNVHHQYFRRGSDGTRLMEHGEIRELMFAVREGSLELDWLVHSGTSYGDLRCGLSIVLCLRNTSRVPVIAPYLRLSDHSWHALNVGQLFSRSSGGGQGIYAGRDVLVHLHDEIEFAQAATGLDFRRTGQKELPAAVEAVRRNGLGSLAMAPINQMTSEAGLTRDRSVFAAGIFGAENVVAKEFCLEIGKNDLLDRFCKMRGIKLPDAGTSAAS